MSLRDLLTKQPSGVFPDAIKIQRIPGLQSTVTAVCQPVFLVLSIDKISVQ